jgi:hypothetical protein
MCFRPDYYNLGHMHDRSARPCETRSLNCGNLVTWVRDMRITSVDAECHPCYCLAILLDLQDHTTSNDWSCARVNANPSPAIAVHECSCTGAGFTFLVLMSVVLHGGVLIASEIQRLWEIDFAAYFERVRDLVYASVVPWVLWHGFGILLGAIAGSIWQFWQPPAPQFPALLQELLEI